MGRNPYIRNNAPEPPRKPYRITVRNTGQVIDVDPANLPDPDHFDGHEGALLPLLLRAGVALDHACGGVVACSTCHVYVNQGYNSAPPPIEEEEDMLDNAPALRASSRLACQCVPDGTSDVEVEIPAWNRNMVKENH